jgi:hypothetical protein
VTRLNDEAGERGEKDGVLCATARRLSGEDADDNGWQGRVGAWA